MPPMLSDDPADIDRRLALDGWLRPAVAIGVVAIVAFGVVLRFWTTSALWLDEALTVNISRLPLHEIPAALKRDGAPPAFYVLLHFWMRLFGDSDVATRSLSGVLAILTLPVAWLGARRAAGRVVAWTVVVLLASAPFAVYYATEARMYALVILLTACGFLALHRSLEHPTPANLIAVALVTAGLLYSQYWSLYLVGMVGLWLAGITWADRRHHDGSSLWASASWRALCAVVVGCLAFVPWLPTFLYQSAHTGTPWAKPANFAAVITAVTGFTDNQASLNNIVTNEGRLLVLVYFAMAALALFGLARDHYIVDLDLHTVPRARGLVIVIVGTLVAAISGGLLTGSAFSSRYAAVVFLPLLLVVALGTTTLLSPRLRVGILAIAVAAGLFNCVQNIDSQRTQAPQVVAVINQQARPGDIIAFCPDQLGPSVSRLTDQSGQYQMITFPRRTGPQFVDWVDYLSATRKGNPASFVSDLLRRAGTRHRIWLVWQVGYQGYAAKCLQIAGDLLNTPRVGGHNWVLDQPTKSYEPMNLTEYAPEGS
jgi:mannosyltransferase